MAGAVIRPDLPNVFLIGAAKAATTSLAATLGEHHEIFVPVVKEPDFFSMDSEFERGLDHYAREHFHGAVEPVRVDASVSYLASPRAADRLAGVEAIRDPKFLVVLREPCDRAYSNYWECRSAGFERATFEQAIAEDAERVDRTWAGRYTRSHLEGSRYGTHLERWSRLFPSAEFHYVRYEDLIGDQAVTLEAVHRFLGVDPSRGASSLRHDNVRRDPRWSPVRLVSAIPESVKRPIRRVIGQGRIDRAVGRADRLAFGERDVPDLDPGVRERLREVFRGEVARAAALTGLDLSAW